ncbi:MAG: MurR/RpiR family transcriptional regulator, partial [Atopostipes suicloacalis]|nr:MurR/RpiR family transcriptional regulator [Atopostipes suicloacalis]
DTIEGYSDIRANESLKDIKEKLLGNAYQSLSDTLPLLDEETIEKANSAIEQAEIVYLFGMGSSYLVAQNISQKWSRIGKTCIVMSDTHSLIASMISGQKKKLFIGISNSGETSEVIQLMKVAQQNGLETMSITQFGGNALSKEAKINLQHIRVNEPAYRGAATVSLHVQFYLVDVLFYAYSSKNYKEVMNHIISSREEIIAYSDK